MLKIPVSNNSLISKEVFKREAICKDNRAIFEVTGVSVGSMVCMESIDRFNSFMTDARIEGGEWLMDLKYKFSEVAPDGTATILVTVDASEYLNENNW